MAVTEIVPLHPAFNADDIVKGLRAIADDIEAGSVRFEPTMAVVVLATETQRRDRTGVTVFHDWQSHALGRDIATFAARGILASAINVWDGPNDA